MNTDMRESKKIKVFIVDDSAFMRAALEKMLREDPSIEIVGSASNGKEAVEKISRLKVDVVTMDVEMPVMDGLHALKEIMRINPVPVIMVSSLTQQGARVTLDALDLGAVDYLAKPGSGISVNILNMKELLIEKVHQAAESKPSVPKFKYILQTTRRTQETSTEQNLRYDKIVVIGASTGGPPAIQQILSSLSQNFPYPIIIAQHMPKAFTATFAQRLNLLCNIRVKEATDGETIQKSIAYICPGDMQTRIMPRPDNTFYFSICSNDLEKLRYAPCIDVLFNSAVSCFGRRTIGVILTGMGEDGVIGLKNIKLVGGLTIAQDKNSCVVYGMPKAAIEQGAVVKIASIQDIASELELACRG